MAGLGSKNRLSSVMQERLSELEQYLLFDDDDEEEAVSASGSAVIITEWSDMMQQLTSLPLPPPVSTVAVPNQLSPPHTNAGTKACESLHAACEKFI